MPPLSHGPLTFKLSIVLIHVKNCDNGTFREANDLPIIFCNKVSAVFFLKITTFFLFFGGGREGVTLSKVKSQQQLMLID